MPTIAMQILVFLTVTSAPYLLVELHLFSSYSVTIVITITFIFFLYFSASNKHLNFRLRSNEFAMIFLFIALTVPSSVISLIEHREFQIQRYTLSIVLAIVFLFEAALFSKLIMSFSSQFIQSITVRYFWFLAALAVAGKIYRLPFLSDLNRPVFTFPEPSTFARWIGPILVFCVISTDSKLKWIYLSVCAAFCVLWSSLTLYLFVFLATLLINSRLTKVISLIFILPAVYYFKSSYIAERSVANLSTQNISALVYLQGAQRALDNFIGTYGIGVGFQQFGIVGKAGSYEAILSSIVHGGLNILDGGFIAAKLIGEFGFIGVFFLLAYVVSGVRLITYTRRRRLKNLESPNLAAIAVAFYLSYAIPLFVRGAGYFGMPTFLFVTSLFILIRLKFKMRLNSSLRSR